MSSHSLRQFALLLLTFLFFPHHRRRNWRVTRMLWAWMTRCLVHTASAWATGAASTPTCLPATTRGTQGPPLPALSAGCLCRFPTPRRRWTWPPNPRCPPSCSTLPPYRASTRPRPSTSHARRSTPRRHGLGRSPLPRCLFRLWSMVGCLLCVDTS